MTSISTVPARRTGTVILLAGALLLGGPLASHRAEAYDFSEAQKRVRNKINNERETRGKPRLRLNGDLSRIAERHSREMAESGSLYHTSRLASRINRTGMDWRIIGENVGVGSSIGAVHDAFMKSDPHRRNILDRRFRKIGVGVFGSGGRVWITIIFLG